MEVGGGVSTRLFPLEGAKACRERDKETDSLLGAFPSDASVSTEEEPRGLCTLAWNTSGALGLPPKFWGFFGGRSQAAGGTHGRNTACGLEPGPLRTGLPPCSHWQSSSSSPRCLLASSSLLLGAFLGRNSLSEGGARKLGGCVFHPPVVPFYPCSTSSRS